MSASTKGPTPEPGDIRFGEGEMAERIDAFDWSATPLGPASSWSPALRTTLRIMLANRFPHLLWWGPEYIQFYNDAYRPIPGAKHPDKILGQRGSECWSEVWHVIGPLVDRPFSGGPPTWDDDIFLELQRHGFLEESHFVIAYSPVPDESAPGGIGGVLATVHEITEKIVGERRVRALRELGARVGEAKSAEEACAIAAETLVADAKDVPFALIYLVEPGTSRARLAGTAGVEEGSVVAPAEVDLSRPDGSLWPLDEAFMTETMQVVEGLGGRLDAVPRGPWSDPPHTAVVVPVPSNKAHELAGLMVLGVSARLRFDDPYRDFFNLVTTQIATAIANARAYEEERKRAEALAELDRAKTAFFSNVSHEFRTPLTLMLGPVEEMLSHDFGALPPAAKGQLEVVNRNGLRLLRLVNALLDFSRIEAGRVRASYEATDLAALTCDLAGVFRAAIERAGLALVLDCPPVSEPVYVDRDMWEKIVLNLLSNAFKYTFEGRILVSLRDRSGAVELVVEDTGIGIPSEEIPRLFERFHRVESARGRTHEGSGIGLALVRELVHLHGGEIEASSTLGEGTAFTLRLPLGTSHLPPEQIVASRQPRTVASGALPFVEEALRWLPETQETGDGDRPDFPGVHEILPVSAAGISPEGVDDRPRVLVADDNADMRHYVERLLAQRYRVETVADGQSALDSARRQPPALILTDVMMPQLDGFGLLREIRGDAALKDTPVIMLSARAGEESRVEGVEAGADDYLVKPFSARELIARVDAHLKLARLRREASEAIRFRGQQFETLLDAAPLGVTVIDADFRIVEVNPVARTAFGDIPDGVLGRDFDEVAHLLLDKEYADEIVRIFRHTLQTGEPYVTAERAPLRIDRGPTEYYEWRLDRLTLPDGRYGLVCYFQDISQQVQDRREREHLLEAEQTARREAEQANRLKDDFVATLSHELRTPLNAILGWSQILKRPKLDSQTLDQGLAAISRSAQAQTQLIEDLLDTTRILSGKLRLELNEVDPADVVNMAIESVMPAATAKQIVVTKSLDEDGGPVAADPSRLQQIVWNLLTNAVKFTPNGGGIHVDLARKDAHLEITVRDTGIGISPEFLPSVFERFRQADSSSSRRYGGLGIGLTLVRQLTDLHRGSVRVESEGEGRGATFTVRLPVSTDRVRRVTRDPRRYERADPAADVALDGVRVLYVDDDPDARALGERILSDCDAEVTLAASASEALLLLRKERPHVLVSDIGLPGADGYELIRWVRELPPDHGGATPAAALTAFAGSEDRRKALRAGYQSHVTKPIVPDDLITVVAGLAGRSRRTRA